MSSAPATSETVMAIACAFWRAEQAGTLGAAMTAAEAQYGHRDTMKAFDVFDRMRRDTRRAAALRALAEAMR
jgi:hypothetical protein